MIHCPKLVRLRDEQSDPEEVERSINFFIPDIEKFLPSRGEGQRERNKKNRQKEREKSSSLLFPLDARDLSTFFGIVGDGSDRKRQFCRLVKEQRERISRDGEYKEGQFGARGEEAIARKEMELGGDDVTSSPLH